jgi:tetratricopeptide (TPR) repeat protein
MQAYSQPLDRLSEALRWFVGVKELLLLYVRSGPELRASALDKIARAQNRPENRAAIFVCTTPVVDGDPDWTARSEELAESMATVAEAAAAAEPPVAIRAPGPAGDGMTGFVANLKRAVAATAPAFDGIILAFAPEGIEKPDVWLTDLRRLLMDRSLEKVRFIVVETEPAPAEAFATELAGLCERVDIRIDPGAMRSYLRAVVEGLKTAPTGADPHRVAGMAGPREAPPARPGRVAPAPETATAELQSAGVSPAFAQPEVMKNLRVEALSASLALQEGRGEEAVQHQIRARDVAENAGMLREATLMQLMLGGYLLQSGGPGPALNVFTEAAKRAKSLGLVELEAQSQMAIGGTLLMGGRPFEAAQAYTTGAVAADKSPSKLLAIECYRMVGQILLANGQPSEAAAAWQRALAVAEGAPKVERIASSAPLAAKDLATMYRSHGLTAQANALDEQVKRWESEVPAAPETPSDGATNAANGSASAPNGSNETGNGGAQA